MKSKPRFIKYTIILLLASFVGYTTYDLTTRYIHEKAILKKIIARLDADTRVAEVLVTGVNYNEVDRKTYTTIKFLEYDSKGNPLKPKYFSFSGNIIQFQSLVVRFGNKYIHQADRLKGRSAYLFWKVFMLDGEQTQEYEIAKINQIPDGYKIDGPAEAAESKFWEHFWTYALDPQRAKNGGIKNAQIEAPGTMFVPGHLYTIKIEHDGGLRIDVEPLSAILLGETFQQQKQF